MPRSSKEIEAELEARGVDTTALHNEKVKEFNKKEPLHTGGADVNTPTTVRKQHGGRYDGLTFEKGTIPRVEEAVRRAVEDK